MYLSNRLLVEDCGVIVIAPMVEFSYSGMKVRNVNNDTYVSKIIFIFHITSKLLPPSFWVLKLYHT